jgi:hypothetical protein
MAIKRMLECLRLLIGGLHDPRLNSRCGMKRILKIAQVDSYRFIRRQEHYNNFKQLGAVG